MRPSPWPPPMSRPPPLRANPTTSSPTSGGWSERSLPLASVLLTPWALFQGASDVVIARAREEGDGDVAEQAGNALEMAVIGQAKRFIKSPSCQKVIGE